jgi:hypothetical protein
MFRRLFGRGQDAPRSEEAAAREEAPIAASCEQSRTGIIGHIALLHPDGSVSWVLAARPGTQVTRRGSLRNDAQGRIRSRITARNGERPTCLVSYVCRSGGS